MDLAELYRHRFDPADRKRMARVWQVLCRHFFQRYVAPDDTVLDLGAGSCEFINAIACAHRIAVDPNPDVADHAAPGVRTVIASSTDLGPIGDGTVDVVFASNFFEHLPDTATFLATLGEIRRVLASGGRLLILQPNIRILGGAYWDFLDHHLPLTERTLVEALDLCGFRVREVRPRFLPYTSKSGLPRHPLLVRLYLMVPLAHRLLGGQAWVVGERP